MKKVAAFNDLSSFGRCSLTAAIPVLSSLAVQCNPIPTMVLTGQGGYPVFYSQDMTSMLPLYTKAWQENKVSFDGIYTGYLTGPSQIKYIEEFLSVFRKEDTFLLVDPVMGDNGYTYQIFSDELLIAMKKLTQQANLITPNLMEACLLSDTPYKEEFSLEEIIDMGDKIVSRSQVPQKVAITGVRSFDRDKSKIYTLLLSKDEVLTVSSHFYNKSFSGTGDLFASTMCGLIMNGYTEQEALPLAVEFLSHSIEDTMRENTDSNDGIYFENHLNDLIKYRNN